MRSNKPKQNASRRISFLLITFLKWSTHLVQVIPKLNWIGNSIQFWSFINWEHPQFSFQISNLDISCSEVGKGANRRRSCHDTYILARGVLIFTWKHKACTLVVPSPGPWSLFSLGFENHSSATIENDLLNVMEGHNNRCYHVTLSATFTATVSLNMHALFFFARTKITSVCRFFCYNFIAHDERVMVLWR